MKSLILVLTLCGVQNALAADTVDAKLIEQFNAHIGDCNAPGMEPKPKMADLVAYLSAHGFKDAKVECGVSNFEGHSPMLMIHLVDGGEIYVNYKNKKVSEVIEDAKTDQGLKRNTLWPASKKKSK